MKRKNEDNSKEIVIRLGLVISAIAFLVVLYVIFNNIIVKSNKIELSGENYYQYFLGMKEEYSGNINIAQNNNNSKLVLENGKSISIDSTPVFYKDVLGKSLFLKEMELVFIDGMTYKLPAYTNVILENNQISVKKINKQNSRTVSNAFIFDGEDLYFFLEETEVKVGKKTFYLSPLSYVIVNYRTDVEIYDYEKDQYTMLEDIEDIKQDVIATEKYNRYKINMSVDSLSTEKSEKLLLSNMKNLNSYLDNSNNKIK